jgi:GNAT superfamily N-acetyltransferase
VTAWTIGRARPAQLAWINQRYAEVDFVPCGPADIVALAEADGVPAGLGRVVPVQDGVGELGGMLVFDEFRRRGLAKPLIAWLLEAAGAEVLYCLPFAPLEGMYAAMGFERVGAARQGPAKGRGETPLVQPAL